MLLLDKVNKQSVQQDYEKPQVFKSIIACSILDRLKYEMPHMADLLEPLSKIIYEAVFPDYKHKSQVFITERGVADGCLDYKFLNLDTYHEKLHQVEKSIEANMKELNDLRE